MNKIKLEGLDETVYSEKLENGINVYILKTKFNSYSAYFIANYGALINKFIPIGEHTIKSFPNGIAHFLEHKLFEQEKGENVMEKFSSLGGTCNAFTNYLYTTFYVTGTDNFNENLNFLIDYVQSPYFTDENVEKEKGIIQQERLMIKDNPYRTFYMKLIDNLFVNYKYGKSLVGEKEDIDNITKEDLYKCYNTFYNPSNMSIIVVSNINPKKVIDIIKKNQSKKKFDKQEIIQIDVIDEPENVEKDYEVFYDNVTKTEVSYAVKMKIEKFDLDSDKLYAYLYILLTSNFGKISGFSLDLKRKNLIDGNVGLNVNKYEDYIILYLTASTDHPEDIVKIFNEKMHNLQLSEENFNLIKKTTISRFVYSFTSVNGAMNYLYDEYYENKTIKNDTFIKYKQLNYDEYVKVFNKIDLTNNSVLLMKPLKEKE